MLIKLNKLRAQSTTEYVFFMVILLGIFIYFQKYLVRGVSGRLRSVGESFAQGRIYDPVKTVNDCAYDFAYGTNKWYNATCFYRPETGCVAKCLGEQIRNTECAECLPACQACINTCVPPNDGCNVPP